MLEPKWLRFFGLTASGFDGFGGSRGLNVTVLRVKHARHLRLSTLALARSRKEL